MIRVRLPSPLQNLAQVRGEVSVEVVGTVSLGSVLDAVEVAYPALRGTMRDQSSLKRRPFIRFYAGEEDISHTELSAELPGAIREGSEPLVVVGAMSGG